MACTGGSWLNYSLQSLKGPEAATSWDVFLNLTHLGLIVSTDVSLPQQSWQCGPTWVCFDSCVWLTLSPSLSNSNALGAWSITGPTETAAPVLWQAV